MNERIHAVHLFQSVAGAFLVLMLLLLLFQFRYFFLYVQKSVGVWLENVEEKHLNQCDT